jgi:hypothetical protein
MGAMFLLAGCSDSGSAPADRGHGKEDGGDPTSGSGGDVASSGGKSSSSSGGSKSGAGGTTSAGGKAGSGGRSGGGGAVGAGGAGAGGSSWVPPITVVDPPSGGDPAAEGTTTLPLSSAPAMPSPVKVVPNRSSVILYLPKVDGARDFRAFVVENGVKVAVTDNREHVDGGTLHCAGLRQRNQCDEGEILPVKYNNEDLDMTTCARPNIDRRPNIPTQLMQTMEIDGVGKDATVVVEAIDRQCPFPGLFGSKHIDQTTPGFDSPANQTNATVNGKTYTLQMFAKTFPLRTEAEIRADYGTMILNGQGPNQPVLDPSSPDFPESPYIRIAQPAPADDPVVLARSVIKVSSTGSASLPTGFTKDDFWEDFDDDSDQPKFVRNTDTTATMAGAPINVLQTKQMVLYDVATYEKEGRGFSDMFVNRGQMNMVIAEPGAMSLQAMYPKRPVHLPDAADQYLHITYRVQRNELPRRYENLTICGSDKPNDTYDGEFPKAAPFPLPGFMDGPHARRTNPLGWNCIYFVPRGPGYWRLDGGDVNSHSDTSLRVTVIKTNPPPATPSQYQSEELADYGLAIGPTQDAITDQWERQIDANGKYIGMWLDDQIGTWQKVKFDVFLRRDKFVIYVEGQQRLCGDLSKSPLTMQDGALGFWHVLYHTSAEFTEIRNGQDGSNPATGQHHILHNSPFADARSWDNVGFRENVALPSNFDGTRCK